MEGLAAAVVLPVEGSHEAVALGGVVAVDVGLGQPVVGVPQPLEMLTVGVRTRSAVQRVVDAATLNERSTCAA